MARVPVVATIRDAYAFTFSNLGGIIGLIWVPMVLLTVMGFFSSQNMVTLGIEAMASGNAARLGPALLWWLGYLLSALFLMAIMYTAVMQLVLGQRTAPSWVHFAFGAPEWRMLRALAAFAGLMILVLLLGNILTSAVAMRMPQAMPLVSLLVQAAMLAFVARFFLLLPAISATETEPVLRCAWLLSSGSFWQMFAILMGFVIPLFLLFILLMVPATMQIPPPPPATSANLQVQQLAMFVWMRQALPYLWGLLFFIWPLVIGLFSSASVSVWRKLKTDPVLDIEA